MTNTDEEFQLKRAMPKQIKNRKITRYIINLWHSDGKTCRDLYVTKKQLEHLNVIDIGKEVFVSPRRRFQVVQLRLI